MRIIVRRARSGVPYSVEFGAKLGAKDPVAVRMSAWWACAAVARESAVVSEEDGLGPRRCSGLALGPPSGTWTRAAPLTSADISE